MTKQTTNRKDAFQLVTNKIIKALEDGVLPWVREYQKRGFSSLPLRSNGERYRGINILSLSIDAAVKEFISPYWLTFKQARALGAMVRKSETGSYVFYASTYIKEEANENGGKTEETIGFLKNYRVFNADQIEGLEDNFFPKLPDLKPINEDSRNQYLDQFFKNTGAKINEKGSIPFYSPSGDFIQLPRFEDFKNATSYYCTLFHELTHWTGEAKRLNRLHNYAAKTGRAKEELVAEIGSAFLVNALGLECRVSNRHAPYISCWLEVLRNDKRAIFKAAAEAQKAVDFVIALQNQQNLNKVA